MSSKTKAPEGPKRRGRGRPSLASAHARHHTSARLSQAFEQIKITEFLSYRDYLLAIYQLIKSQKASYSYGQLAEDLGFSRSNVIWLVISGRRKISPSACERLASALKLSPNEKKYFETMRRYNNARRTDEREMFFREMMELKGKELNRAESRQALEYFSEWYHPVLRELVGLSDFQRDPNWVNDRLVYPLMPMQIHKSLELLENLGLIVYERKRGRYVPTGGQVYPDREVERFAQVRFHQKMCDMAREAMTRVAANRRDMNTMTVRISDETAMQASKILYKACEQIMKLESDQKQGDQIFQINVQLFPLTKTIGKQGE